VSISPSSEILADHRRIDHLFKSKIIAAQCAGLTQGTKSQYLETRLELPTGDSFSRTTKTTKRIRGETISQ
jgi:hypothetical protein